MKVKWNGETEPLVLTKDKVYDVISVESMIAERIIFIRLKNLKL